MFSKLKELVIFQKQKYQKKCFSLNQHLWLMLTWLFCIIPIFIKWGWSLLSCWNVLICNLHQMYSAISVIHSMLKQYCGSKNFYKICKLMGISPKHFYSCFSMFSQGIWGNQHWTNLWSLLELLIMLSSITLHACHSLLLFMLLLML